MAKDCGASISAVRFRHATLIMRAPFDTPVQRAVRSFDMLRMNGIEGLRANGMGEVSDMEQPKGLFCGMPMEKPEDFGMNANGFRNNDYCQFCLKDGCFTEPHITMQQMIDKVAGMAGKMNMSEAQAREMAKGFIPKLKRWR